ncbi:MAG: hypothetical protein H6807_00615 [Planctomycetes bacterium]|nr:hypothetical protein [Planctomycetota bacterium]
MRKELDGERVAETAERLSARIEDRFPGSGLLAVSQWVATTSHNAVARTAEIRRPYRGLRVLSVGLIATLVISLVGIALGHGGEFDIGGSRFEQLVQILQATIQLVVFVGAAVVFLWTLEGRMKRSRMLQALHELRSMAHVVDMHQLTKDPERIKSPGTDTRHSPKRDLSPFLLGRYLDYSSELLSVISKIAAQYAARSTDPVVLDAVDQIETLTTGLSRKIWQKLMLLVPELDKGDD